jgi:hypothetical protein
MLFVDGENLTIRGQALAKSNNVPLAEGPYYRKDSFIWFPNNGPTRLLDKIGDVPAGTIPIRTYYFASATGADNEIRAMHDELWSLGLHPGVFKKERKQDKAKGVDISMATEMLTHAFTDNYDAAILFAGDGDYVPLVQQIKRLGKIVCVAFFGSEGLSRDLLVEADVFIPIDRIFLEVWFDWSLVPSSESESSAAGQHIIGGRRYLVTLRKLLKSGEARRAMPQAESTHIVFVAGQNRYWTRLEEGELVSAIGQNTEALAAVLDRAKATALDLGQFL